jgi:calcium-dependent protein kinase
MISKSTLIGQYISDITQSYTFTKELGSGSYGTVYRVQNKLTGEFRACKKLNKRKITNPTRFKLEIDLLKATDHPNIVRLYEIYEDNVYLYLIMEECLGGEFFDRLAERAKNGNLYTEREAAKIFRELLEAINYCHSHGVCHRDIKPENILFSSKDENSTLKICDFGLSKVFSMNNKIMNSIVGTTYYMAPEVLTGTYDEKCDVWSAGVILYIILCGRPPFYGKTDPEIMRRIKNKNYSFDFKEWNVVSNQAKELIKSIFVDAGNRPSSEQILNTSWVIELAPHSTGEVIDVDWDDVKKYSKLNKIQKCVISFASFRLRDEDTKELKEIFKSIDVNSDGVLSAGEMHKGFEILRKKFEEKKKNKTKNSFKSNNTGGSTATSNSYGNSETSGGTNVATNGGNSVYNSKVSGVNGDFSHIDGKEVTFSGPSIENVLRGEVANEVDFNMEDVAMKNDDSFEERDEESDVNNAVNKVEDTNIDVHSCHCEGTTVNKGDNGSSNINGVTSENSENISTFTSLLSCEDISSVFGEIDLDKNGLINYNEFIAATVDYKHKIKQDHIFEAFRSYDKDRSGKLSFKELLEVIKPQTSEDIDYLKNLFFNYDKNHDGEIDWEEFLSGLELY